MLILLTVLFCVYSRTVEKSGAPVASKEKYLTSLSYNVCVFLEGQTVRNGEVQSHTSQSIMDTLLRKCVVQ